MNKLLFQKVAVNHIYIDESIGTLHKPQQQQQRGHGKTMDLIGRAITLHVCFKTLYIS